MRRWMVFLCAGVSSAMLACSASAQTYPAKPIHIVVPFTAGGLLDGLARGLGTELTSALGQPVIVENRPGANTIIGAEAVARAAPDGYTLLFATDATVSINPFLYSKLSYNPERDFVPVSLVAMTIECLLVSASVPVTSVKELVELAKAQPGKLNYASFGPGSSPHLAGEMFKVTTGVDLVHVPFKGVAEVMPALLANQVQVAFSSQAQALPHIRAGKIKALAVFNERRQPTLPDTPTMAEAGYPDFDSRAWFGLMAPAATPREIVAKLSNEIVRIVNAPEFRDKFISGIGLQPVGSTPEQFAAMLRVDRERYAKKVKAANVKLD